MNFRRAIPAAPALIRHPTTVLGRRHHLLILSHMRSYSSVLSHVLGSHDEIAGYAEMHQAYDRALDLRLSRARVARSLDWHLDGRFVLDKVLHDRHPVSPALLDRSDVRALFLVRRPPETVASIVAAGMSVVTPLAGRPPVEAAAAYYAERVRTLAGLARDMRSQALFMPAELVVDDPDAVLSAIAGYLGLTHVIEPSYRRFKHTGEPSWGDTSDLIRTGRIGTRTERPCDIELPQARLDAIWEAYEECWAAAARHRGLAPAV